MTIGLVGKWSDLLCAIGRVLFLVALFDLLLTATTNLGAGSGKPNAGRRAIGQPFCLQRHPNADVRPMWKASMAGGSANGGAARTFGLSGWSRAEGDEPPS